jgi:hypothetical protein
MEQVIQTLLGMLLIALVGLALVSALAILVLIECGWIVRLGGQLYWRCRAFMQSLRDSTMELRELERRRGEPADQNRQPVHHPDQVRPGHGTTPLPGRDGGPVERPDDERK